MFCLLSRQLALVCLLSGAATAVPVVLYDNGFNGTSASDGFNSLGPLTDSFQLLSGATVGGFRFTTWMLNPFVDDRMSTVTWSIRSASMSVLASGTTNPTDQLIGTVSTQPSADLYHQFVTIPDLALTAGVYFLQLSAGQNSLGFQGFWDVSNGPSNGFRGAGLTPTASHSFQILSPDLAASAPELDPRSAALPLAFCFFGGLLLLQRRTSAPDGCGA